MSKSTEKKAVRVLYSFPHRLGAGRICWTAWQQVLGLDSAGADVTAIVGSALRVPPADVKLRKTLSLGRRLRIPFRLLGARRMAMLHDWRTSHWLKSHSKEIDIVHTWPLGSLYTIRAAKKLGIPVVMERPNTHTGFAYEVVDEECGLIDFKLPDGYEHKFDAVNLAHELTEYAEGDFLLCPSEFVERTFLDKGFSPEKLLRHQYGYDQSAIWPGDQTANPGKGLVMIYVGLCTPRKGLHYALQAWLASKASQNGRFMICGDFVPGYREKLGDQLNHPSIEILGHRNDIPELMRQSDLFVLSSIEEGSALVTYEARGSGCVLLVSDASGAVCSHLENAMVHASRDLDALTSHIDRLNDDRELLGTLRSASISQLDQLTWHAAGARLLEVYQEALDR
ncbi:MAG: glycosyltransferase family 4 protein [Luteolibacter sp.]|uniref:glycosyltransferase family 4 protein n=1 Tax=Luteolibacter sp. TaxID=1962973 RepID=UPI0032660AA9